MNLRPASQEASVDLVNIMIQHPGLSSKIGFEVRIKLIEAIAKVAI